MWSTTILLIHLSATWAMVGLIWFVQIVHYPLFANVETSFNHYEQLHQQRTTWVVAPIMLAELVTAVLLAFSPTFADVQKWCWLGLGLVLLIWLSTAFLQVPCHKELAKEYNLAVIDKLVRTNWIRTAAWSLRGCLAIFLLVKFADFS